jgi:hypothetical protein
VKFEPVNVELSQKAVAEVANLGAFHLPAVKLGQQVFVGWNPKALAAFLGVAYSEDLPLSAPELTARLDRILAAAQTAVRQVPDREMDRVAPGRNRTVREIGYHIFRLSLAYRDMIGQRLLSHEWIREEVPSDILSGEALAHYGHSVRETLRDLFMTTDSCSGTIETEHGIQTVHMLLERTVWHAAQHLRQLYVLLEVMGETPMDQLTDEDFKGLPLPDEIW